MKGEHGWSSHNVGVLPTDSCLVRLARALLLFVQVGLDPVGRTGTTAELGNPNGSAGASSSGVEAARILAEEGQLCNVAIVDGTRT